VWVWALGSEMEMALALASAVPVSESARPECSMSRFEPGLQPHWLWRLT
jgi:hypothetical protein